MATGSHLVSRLRSTSVDKYKRRAQLRLSWAIVGLVFVNVFGGSTVSGDLSADENEVSGNFSLNAPYSPQGTWSANRK
ncbi:MAG: hypothetical protein WAU34_10555 [Desulfobacterales bacterium]